jgi:ATP:cob(I)alamin adenosyltransferase
MKKSSVYTRTGDEGFTSLYTGQKCRKDDIYIRALGLIDKLNTTIGIAIVYCMANYNGLHIPLTDIQVRLFEIGSAIATPRTSTNKSKVNCTTFSSSHVDKLERSIDELDHHLPALRNFILPGGGLASLHLHAARADCRLAESVIVQLMFEYDSIDASVPRYINRLSDYLFVAARYAAHQMDEPETIYQIGLSVLGSE